ncbi:MAG: cation:proton antiporter subunit C [Desulfobacterales bacterium]|nr:cation:proton antiporter subunit C [Desulfobacterales bacterium]
MFDFIVSYYNYWVFIGLMMVGFYAMMAKRNLIKKIIGMNIFQSAIIFFYISTSVKKGGVTVPILEHGHAAHAADGLEHGAHAVDIMQYANPLPHVLMLTAIVVMVATLGVALAVAIMIYRRYNTLEEDEIIKLLRRG